MSSKHFKFISSLLIVGTIALGTGCKSETPIGPGTDANANPAPTDAPPAEESGTTTSTVASINAEVYLKVERRLMDATLDAPKTSVGLCQVTNSTGTPTSPNTVTCNPTYGGAFSVPEGDLHFSNLYFTVGTSRPDRCAFLVFRPYYYMGSTAAYDPDNLGTAPGFLVPWLNTLPPVPIDCSLGIATAGCFNGPAVSLVPGFPNVRSLVYLTDQVLESVSTLTSAYSNDQSSNRFVANNEAAWGPARSDASQPTGYQSYYVGDTAAATAGYPASGPLGYGAAHQDYVVECRDRYFDVLSQVIVKINDEDTSTSSSPSATYDFFHTWP